ncbi:fibroleukin-like [Dreissena polymorpha]|uniref:Fibrinogen C-terminal domain-containing protein n=1 Tax=Dreissena polymorpha TaxID=45954 RepID=A0A9D4EH63_DREPO|nr:fibroleukin-like [Dreissena polymorpha]KAH3779248.1 hypothetical protein DPMN_157048 [Dreissena polymorpha]
MYDTLNNLMTKFSKETTELRDDLLREVKRMDDSKEKEPEFKNASIQVKSLVQRLGALTNNFTSHVTQCVSRIESDMMIIQGVCNTSGTRNDVHPKPTSCDDVDKSGVHTIYPDFKPSGLEVYCEIDQGKAWLVIQRRKYGTVDFYRSWEEYKTGFGNVSGDFWLGNEFLHHLTKYKSRQLLIDMETFEGKKAYAMYDEFGLSSEAGKYKLSIKGFNGDVQDRLTMHTGKMFSTNDADNDDTSTRCCSCIYRGGWWFTDCFDSHLNGKYYYKHETVPSPHGIWWFGFESSLRYVAMKLH